MFARLGKGTRKFREPKTPKFPKAGAEWVRGNMAFASQAKQVAWSDAKELSGSCSVYEGFEVRHPYSILTKPLLPAELGEIKLAFHTTASGWYSSTRRICK
jgi:hypothetical protein